MTLTCAKILKTVRSWSLSCQGITEVCVFYCWCRGHSWLGMGQVLAARPCHDPPRRAPGSHLSALTGVTGSAYIPRAGMRGGLDHGWGGVMPWAQDRQGQKAVPSRAWKNHPGNTSCLNKMLKLGVVDTKAVSFRIYHDMSRMIKKAISELWDAIVFILFL